MSDNVTSAIDYTAAEESLYMLKGVRGVLENLASIPERSEYETDSAMFFMLARVISGAEEAIRPVTRPRAIGLDEMQDILGLSELKAV